MMFDSNGRYIDRRKLWKIDKSVFKRCGNLHAVNKVIEENDFEELKYALISLGINDLDTKGHEYVFNEKVEIIDKTRLKYSGIKLILNEITPRNDKRDTEVIKCNILL